VQEAAAAIERLAAVPTDPGFVLNEALLLRKRALLARAHGDDTAYGDDYQDRHRALATSLDFEGHMQWADAMLLLRQFCTSIDGGRCGGAGWRLCGR
jgi:adenylate cyclase